MSSNMEKEFIPYELAVKLKALRFNEPCLKNWDSDLLMVCDYATHLKAPLYQQAFRWFREKYELFHSIRYQDDNSGPGGFDYEIQNKRGKQLNQGEYLEFKTYEEAELECLTKLIEIVEKQIDAADSKEALEYIRKGEFEILRTLCMGGPQISELNRLFTIMKTKYKYVK